MDDENRKRFEIIEKRLDILEGKDENKDFPKMQGSKIKKGSTTDKINELILEGFFDKPKSITNIVEKLKTKDYHFKSPGLTLPIRVMVRKGLLKKTKDLEDGSKSKIWVYIKCRQ